MGLLTMSKLHIFQLFLCFFTLQHKNIEAENVHRFPPQLLTFNQNILLNFIKFYNPISKGISSVPSPSNILTFGDRMKIGRRPLSILAGRPTAL